MSMPRPLPRIPSRGSVPSVILIGVIVGGVARTAAIIIEHDARMMTVGLDTACEALPFVGGLVAVALWLVLRFHGIRGALVLLLGYTSGYELGHWMGSTTFSDDPFNAWSWEALAFLPVVVISSILWSALVVFPLVLIRAGAREILRPRVLQTGFLCTTCA